MNDALYVAAYWGPARQDAEECASRLATCLEALGRLSPVFANWRSKGASLREAVAGEELDASRLVEALRRGVHRRDADGSAIPELGFSCRRGTAGRDRRPR